MPLNRNDVDSLNTDVPLSIALFGDEKGVSGDLYSAVEYEEPDTDTFSDVSKPWDPSKIRVSTKNFSLRNVLDLIAEGSLELAPDFQRAKVWKNAQKARLIESVLLQIPLPTFYFTEDEDGEMHVIDGMQRLSTIQEFVREEAFSLKDLEYIELEKDSKFSDLPDPWKRRIHNTQIVAHVIDPTTPSPVKYDIFRRINTGGSPLTAQEIRHCMSNDRSRAFLKACTKTEEFSQAAAYLVGHKRMVDREVVLRFVAFKLLGSIKGYREKNMAMEDFLRVTTENLDDPKKVSDSQLDLLIEDLRKGVRLSMAVFGDNAYRKWTLEHSKRNPFNRALFETWTYALSSADEDRVLASKKAIADEARREMTVNSKYIDSVSVSTSSPNKVEYRFKVVEDILRRCLDAF
ncbi:DUF262 domain-containing protein [Dermabacteraceae bacterium P9123]